MTQKILLFLAFPFFVFGTIEIAKTPATKKVEAAKESTPIQETVEAKQSPEKPSIADNDDDDMPRPEGSNPNFLDPGYNKHFFKTLIFICLLILFGLIVVFIYRRASPIGALTKKNSRNNIKILERRSLSPQTYLYHIQVGNKQFILSESKVDVRSVANLDWPEN